MKNIEQWKPSKYVYKGGKLRASRNSREMGITSRLVADLTAQFYDKALKTYARGYLLDLGCGKVPFYIAYKDKIDASMCVDWENSFHHNDFLDQHADLNQTLNFGDNTFDTILLSDVLEHIRRPEQLWNEMNRILKPGGILILNVPFHYWIHEQPFDYYRYTRFALENFAVQSDFELIETEALGGALEVLTDFNVKLYGKLPLVGNFLAIIFQQINWLFVQSKIGKKVLKATSEHFVLSYGLVARKNRVI